MKTVSIAGLVLAVLTAASPVAAKTYICKLQENGRTNFIPKIVRIDQNGGNVTVIDPLIDHYMGNPISAKIAVDNNRRTTFSWRLKGVKGRSSSGGATVSISYRLTIQKSSHAATISAVIASFDNKPSGQGSCEVRN